MADKFRQAKTPSHVRIFRRQMQSVAWLHLSGSAAKVLLALTLMERGTNNGEFFLSVRKASEMTGLGKDTCNRALHELMDKGFIYCTERGGFSRKMRHAACWGLTWVPGPKDSPHRAPSHAYEKWRPPENHGLDDLDKPVPELGTGVENRTLNCPQNEDSNKAKTAENCQNAPVHESGTHTSDQPLLLADMRWHVGWLPESIRILSVVVFWSTLAAQLRSLGASPTHRRP